MISRADFKKSKIYPVLVLEAAVSERNLSRLATVLEIVFLLLAVVILGGSLYLSSSGLPNAAALEKWLEYKLLGALSLVLSLFLGVSMVRAYLRSSYYFENVLNNRYRPADLYTFTVGRILYRSGEDVLRGFLLSATGGEIMDRLGIDRTDRERFLRQRSGHDFASSLTLSDRSVLKLNPFVSALYDDNPDFGKLLFKAGVGKAELLSVTDWVVKGIEAAEMRVRWWRRENLERLPPIGRAWSYGATPNLDKYCVELLDRPEAQFSAYEVSFRDREVGAIAAILAGGNGANVLLVGDSEPSRFDVLFSFIKGVKRGTVFGRFDHKRVLLLKNSLLLAAFKERSAFEQEVIRIFDEAARAGDVILVLDDLADLLSGAAILGSQLFGLLDQYLASDRLAVIAMADIDKFHRSLESRPEIMNRFERVMIPELSAEQIVTEMLPAIDRTERENRVRFTYQALKELVSAADSYFPDGSLADKSRDLIIELVPWFSASGRRYIMPDDVSAYVSQKTSIPAGAISDKEKDILLNLETVLHERIIGQEAAVTAVAGAMKRARTGIVNPKRPLASFLFMGPTGVGKTETAKALTFAYFGTEDKLMRLDMTEYQDETGLGQLIGSFESGKPGVLTSLIRKNVFGVMLLDEFEKSSKDVQDLFLQIIDEGVFTDMDGKKVNARNIIFIATSNAGAGAIWKMVKAGQDPAAAKDVLIDQIVAAGTYKPELLNRFDDVVIFHPLAPDELKQVAALMLKKLAKRLETKGIALLVNDWLIGKVSVEGANEVFGARPMNRYIQNRIEQAIADKMLESKLSSGMSVEFTSGMAAVGADGIKLAL